MRHLRVDVFAELTHDRLALHLVLEIIRITGEVVHRVSRHFHQDGFLGHHHRAGAGTAGEQTHLA